MSSIGGILARDVSMVHGSNDLQECKESEEKSKNKDTKKRTLCEYFLHSTPIESIQSNGSYNKYSERGNGVCVFASVRV